MNDRLRFDEQPQIISDKAARVTKALSINKPKFEGQKESRKTVERDQTIVLYAAPIV